MKSRHLLVLGGLAAAAYAVFVEPRWLRLRHARVGLPGLPPALDGLRIGLVADLHAGGDTPPAVIRAAAAALRRAHPDLIAVAGDLADREAGDFAAGMRFLRRLRAPLGVFAVPGNHDLDIGLGEWRAALEQAGGVQDLTNRWELIDVGGARLCVAGVDDFGTGDPRLTLPPADRRDATVLLSHWPDAAEQLRRRVDAVDLVLSGHTHGGQIRLPFIGAPINPSAHGELYEAGMRQRPWTQVYVSRGVGTSGIPVRFGVRPEVAIIELRGS
jgi:uncharacterized protein